MGNELVGVQLMRKMPIFVDREKPFIQVTVSELWE